MIQPRRTTTIITLAAAIVASAGCQQTRRINITSEPSGARVALNDIDVGLTPLEVDFTWFGTYDVRLSKQGYEPLWTQADAKPRLHDQPGLDLLAAFVPGGTETVIDWHFELTPANTSQPALLDRAAEARSLLDQPTPATP